MWTRRDRPSRRPSCSNGGWRHPRVRKSASRLDAARAGMRSPTGRDPLAALSATGERATRRVAARASILGPRRHFDSRPGGAGVQIGLRDPETPIESSVCAAHLAVSQAEVASSILAARSRFTAPVGRLASTGRGRGPASPRQRAVATISRAPEGGELRRVIEAAASLREVQRSFTT